MISDRNENLKNRTRKFALTIIKLVEMLPKTRTADIIGKQLRVLQNSKARSFKNYFYHKVHKEHEEKSKYRGI